MEAQVEDSIFPVRRSAEIFCHYSIFVLLIEISFSYLIHVHNYEYCIHGCSYFAYTWWFIYVRVGLTLWYTACLSCLLLLRANCEYKRVGKAQWGSTSIVRNKVWFISLSVRCVYLSFILERIYFWFHVVYCGTPKP